MSMKTAEMSLLQFNGERARSYADHLTRYHRPLGSEGFAQAADWVAEQLRRFGIEQIRMEHYPGDGKTRVFTWTLPPAWNPVSAQLMMVKPHAAPLVSFPEIPTCLLINSAPTPLGGIKAELVDVGEGTRRSDYANQDVRQKIVLGRGNTNVLSELAIGEMGAAGIVSDFMVETPGYRERSGLPDLVSEGTLRSFAARGEYKGFGFSVSHRQAQQLRTLLQSRRVVLHAEVKAQLGHQDFSVLAAKLPGTRADLDLLVITHLCHPAPGANDNASGVAATMELARVLAEKARLGRKLAASVRFLFVPEFFGTLAYLERHKDDLRSVRAAFCLDQVGEDQELCGSTLFLERTPDCLPHIVSVLCEHHLVEEAARHRGRLWGKLGRFRYQVSPYTGGSDHYPLNDPSIGIPTVLFLNWPDFYYHSQEDTPDKIDPAMLELVGRIVESSIVDLSTLSLRKAEELTDWVAEDTLKRFGVAIRDFRHQESWATSTRLRYLAEAGEGMIQSISPFLSDRDCEAFMATQAVVCQRLRDTADQMIQTWTSNSNGGEFPAKLSCIPKRTFVAPLYRTEFTQHLSSADRQWWDRWAANIPSFPLFFDLFTFHMDGRRTLAEILCLIELNYGIIPRSGSRTATELLARHGFVELVDSESSKDEVEK